MNVQCKMVVAALLAALAGCGSMSASRQPAEAPSRPSDRVNLSGYSPAFKQGYADGCDSAGARQRRNESRYKTDADYMMGWNDGNSACIRRR